MPGGLGSFLSPFPHLYCPPHRPAPLFNAPLGDSSPAHTCESVSEAERAFPWVGKWWKWHNGAVCYSVQNQALVLVGGKFALGWFCVFFLLVHQVY